MPATSTSVLPSFAPSFSLAALLLVFVGLAIIGNTLVGGLPDKVLALAKSTPKSPGLGAGAAPGLSVIPPKVQ